MPLRSAVPAAVMASPVARCTLARVSGVSGSATSIASPSSSSIQTEPIPDFGSSSA